MHRSQSAKQSIIIEWDNHKGSHTISHSRKKYKGEKHSCFVFFHFSVYVWSVVITEGLEVKSRNGKLQRRRPVLQWMSGQHKDMAGMGDNWSWREVQINIGWVFGPLSWLIHVLPHLQAENECRDWWWRWSRWWNRRQVGVWLYLKLGIIRVGVEWHSTAADTWGMKRLGPRPWGDGEHCRKAAWSLLDCSGWCWRNIVMVHGVGLLMFAVCLLMNSEARRCIFLLESTPH